MEGEDNIGNIREMDYIIRRSN